MITNPKANAIACVLVVIFGLLQMIGHVTGLESLKNAAKLTVASPLPLVFTSVKGVETFAQDFYLVYGEDGQSIRQQITPQLYSTFSASYNFRNVLGAAVSYAPVLPDEIRNAVLHYFFIENKEISSALRIPHDATNLRLEVVSKRNQQSLSFPIGKTDQP